MSSDLGLQRPGYVEKIKFPKLNEFNFDKDKYRKAMDYIKNTLGIDYKKRMSKVQLEKLYPTDQPEVFKRLIAESEGESTAVKKFESKLKELQSLTSQSWMDRL